MGLNVGLFLLTFLLSSTMAAAAGSRGGGCRCRVGVEELAPVSVLVLQLPVVEVVH